MTNPDGQSCHTCFFWDMMSAKQRESDMGHCRRFPPPQPAGRAQPASPSWWPVTRLTEWCGEWRQK
jgi:hypothetical protein